MFGERDRQTDSKPAFQFGCTDASEARVCWSVCIHGAILRHSKASRSQ